MCDFLRGVNSVGRFKLIRITTFITRLEFCRDRVTDLVISHEFPRGVDPKLGRGRLHQKQFISKVCSDIYIYILYRPLDITQN